MKLRLVVPVLLFCSIAGSLAAQSSSAWHDPSPHTIQFVTVDKDVKLEVLDWGGSGRPLVFLAGLGDTAHVFDDFAPKLTSEYHVYGITRRGFGASSAPTSGYSGDQLGDDVVAVLDALQLKAPVLVGHSRAGEELSSVATRHPNRIAGLIYLDAAYAYAYYDPSVGDLRIDLYDLESKLDRLKPSNGSPDSKLVQELLKEDLPRFEGDLQELQKDLDVPKPPTAPEASNDDRASFAAYRSWMERTQGLRIPEAELRQILEAKPDGSVGNFRGLSSGLLVIQGGQKYTNIRLPVLAIYAVPHDMEYYGDNLSARATAEARDVASTEAMAKAFERGVPAGRVVRLAHASHYVFLSNEPDVLREMRQFLAGLP